MDKYRIRKNKLGVNSMCEFILEKYDIDNVSWEYVCNTYERNFYDELAVVTLKEKLNDILNDDIVEVFER